MTTITQPYVPAVPQDDTVLRLVYDIENKIEFVRRLCRTRMTPKTRQAVVRALNRIITTGAYTVNAISDDEVMEMIEEVGS